VLAQFTTGSGVRLKGCGQIDRDSEALSVRVYFVGAAGATRRLPMKITLRGLPQCHHRII